MSHHHERLVCACGAVIATCRCPDEKVDRIIRSDCEKCAPRVPGAVQSAPTQIDNVGATKADALKMSFQNAGETLAWFDPDMRFHVRPEGITPAEFAEMIGPVVRFFAEHAGRSPR